MTTTKSYKAKLLLCLAMMLALTFGLATSAAAGDSDSIYTSCNMYSQPGGGAVVRYCYAGMPVTIDESRGAWTAIITLDQAGNHIDGWVSTANLTYAGNSARSVTYTPTYTTYYAPQAVPSGNAHTVLTATMHAGPDENTATVGTIPINVPVTVTQNAGNGWIQVAYNGAYGYISNSAVSYYSAPSSAVYG